MHWEPWLESAESYQELRKALIKRGFKNLYTSSKPIYDGTSLLNPPDVSLKQHPKQKTMVRRKD